MALFFLIPLNEDYGSIAGKVRQDVKLGIESVVLVSDGIIIGFNDGTRCYYSLDFLENHIGLGSNQIFLDHEPTGTITPMGLDRKRVPSMLPC